MKSAAPRFNPFPGLRTFEPKEEHLFFGREQQIDELLKRLRRTRFLAVVGISGSGKSSMVLSGLIPSLHRGLMTRAGSGWRVAIFRPGDDPIGHLASALSAPGVLGEEGEHGELRRSLVEASLRRGALGLVECVGEARDVKRLPKYENVLVVVDQFEELFRLKGSARIRNSENEALAFVRLLQEASQQQEVPIYIVMTMRTDFLEHCVEFPGLPEAINDGAFLVSRMNREEQRAAIVGPVAVGGGAIAPRLVLRLLNSVSDDPDQLPVLQHSLMRTWDYWERQGYEPPTLDLEQYEAIGTMEHALSQHAEEEYAALGSKYRQMIAEKMFKALTDKVPGRRGVRRPIQVREVCEFTGASPEEVIAVADRFRRPGRSFLMPPIDVELDADSVIDISHESLMRVWDRLIGWVEEETEAAQFYLRLSRAAALHEEGSAGLWRDPELEFALRWHEKNGPTEAWARRYDSSFERNMSFLAQSRTARGRELAAEERERLKKLRQARRMTTVAAAVAAVILIFGLFAWQQRAKAEDERERAIAAEQDAREAAEEARRQELIAKQREQEARDSAEEARRHRTIAEQREQEARDSAEEAKRQRSIAEQREREARDSAAEAKRQEQIASQQEKAALEEQAKAVKERERARAAEKTAREQEQEAQRLRILESARALAIQTPRMLREDETLAALLAVHAYRITRIHGGDSEASDFYQALRLSAARSPSPSQAVLRPHNDEVHAVLWLPDRRLVSGSDGGGVRLVDPSRPLEEARTLSASGGEIRSLAVSPAGARLAAGDFGGSVQVWDLSRDGAPPRHLLVGTAREGAHPGGSEPAPVVEALAFRDDGILVSGTSNGEVKLWHLDTPGAEATLLLGGHPHKIMALAVSPNGRRLAAASAGGGVLLWDLESPGPPAVLGTPGDVRSVAFSRDREVLARGNADGTILLWDLARDPAVELGSLVGHTASVNALDFSSRGDLLTSASSDRSVRLWRLDESDSQPVILNEHERWVWSVAISADGDTVASAGADRTIRLWPTRAELLAAELCGRLARDLTREERRRYLPSDLAYTTTCPVD